MYLKNNKLPLIQLTTTTHNKYCQLATFFYTHIVKLLLFSNHLKLCLLFQTNNQLWPYPCSRPVFKTCWLYRTVNFKTISAAALQLRIFWACLRWDDMQVSLSIYRRHSTEFSAIVIKSIVKKPTD